MRILSIIFTYTLLIAWAIFVSFPIYWTITTSFKGEADVYLGPKYFPWVDFQPTLKAWKRMLTVEKDMVLRPLTNSMIIATISSLLAMIFGSMAAYGLTRYQFKLGPLRNRDILTWIVSQRIMPPIVTVLALFLILKVVNLLDTQAGMILVYTAFNLPLAVWMMRNFLVQLPPSIEEAAMVDGASSAQTFFRIVIPMTLPCLAATFLLCFVFAWNEFLFALFLTYNKAQTMPLLIAAQHFQRGPQWWDISVLAVIAIAPVVIIALFLQRYLVKGLIPLGR
jgi:multiple sugar transport system permease protein